MGLADFKNKKRDLNKLRENSGSSQYQEDTRFYKFTVDKQQNGAVDIRFLPGVAGEEENSIIKYSQYFIHTPKGIFYTPAPENAGLPSFPKEVASDIWALYKKTANEDYKKMFIERVAKEYYITNIYVVRDPDNPENEGKVFLFKFGRQIYDMIFEQMGIDTTRRKDSKPKNELLIDEMIEPYDPANPYDGATMRLISFSSTGQALNRSYTKSKFLPRAPIADTDAEIERIYNQQYSLQEFRDPSHYPTYDELKKRYIDMTGDYYDLFPEKYKEAESLKRAIPKSERNYGAEVDLQDDPPFDVPDNGGNNDSLDDEYNAITGGF